MSLSVVKFLDPAPAPVPVEDPFLPFFFFALGGFEADDSASGALCRGSNPPGMTSGKATTFGFTSVGVSAGKVAACFFFLDFLLVLEPETRD